MRRFERSERVADEIKRHVGDILSRSIKSHSMTEVTVIDVELTGDLREATIFYSVLGDEDQRRAAATKLRRVSNFVQSEVGRRLRVRSTPKLSFKYDPSIQRGMRIEELLRSIDEEREDLPSEGSDASEGSSKE